MKPLLPAPWTSEDTDIWLRWARRYGWRVYACMLANVQTTGDRRDAGLMLKLTKRQQFERAMREEFGVYMPGPAAVAMVNGCEL